MTAKTLVTSLPDARTLARPLAVSRVLYGSGLVLAPGLFGRPWIGRLSGDPRAQAMLRAFGVRDLALGVGGLLSLSRQDAGRARWWFGAQAVSDLVDALATLAAGRALTRRQRAGVAMMGSGAAAVAALVAHADPEPMPEVP